MTISNSTNCRDRCGRSLDGKGYIMIMGMKICGVCQFENNQEDIDPEIRKIVNDNFEDLI